MRWSGVAAGALLAVLAVLVLWGAGVAVPPEGLSRTLAVLSAAYPGPTAGAVAERIPCPPLRRLRLYVVCMQDCEDVWMIVGVRGLWAENLANPGRVPPAPVVESRVRIRRAIASEGLSLDDDSAREMIACYLRLEGFLPALVLGLEDLVALEGVRDSEDAMRRLAEGLETPDAVRRIEPRDTGDGYAAHLFYWDTARPGRPVLEMDFDLEKDGVLRSFLTRESPRGGGSSIGASGTPPADQTSGRVSDRGGRCGHGWQVAFTATSQGGSRGSDCAPGVSRAELPRPEGDPIRRHRGVAEHC